VSLSVVVSSPLTSLSRAEYGSTCSPLSRGFWSPFVIMSWGQHMQHQQHQQQQVPPSTISYPMLPASGPTWQTLQWPQGEWQTWRECTSCGFYTPQRKKKVCKRCGQKKSWQSGTYSGSPSPVATPSSQATVCQMFPSPVPHGGFSPPPAPPPARTASNLSPPARVVVSPGQHPVRSLIAQADSMIGIRRQPPAAATSPGPSVGATIACLEASL